MTRLRIFGAFAIIAMSGTSAAGGIGDHWSIARAEGSGYEATVLLTQESADAILDENGSGEVHPVLSFSCSAGGDGTVTFQIDWRRFISSFNTEVGFRVDGSAATWLKLGVDSTNKITVSKAADAAKLIETISDGNTLNVEVAPYSEPSVFVNFDVSTFATALQQLEDSCTSQ